jgi:phage terminase large subunit-like protein
VANASPTLLDRLLAMSADERQAVLNKLGPAHARALRYAWRGLWARADQLAPGSPGAAPALRGQRGLIELVRARTLPAPSYSADWTTWLVLGGRGAGKTRVGGEQVIEWAKQGPQPPIHLVGATMADVRDVMVCENPQPDQSGIIAISEPGFVPRWYPSKRKLVWPNGVSALGFSADEPERLRGPQCGRAWADDVAAWGPTTRDMSWDMMMFGLRLGDRPQCVATTTPKPVPWLIGGRAGHPPLGMLNDATVMITRVRTEDNRRNLAGAFIGQVVNKYAGTRLGRQELEAEILTDIEGALWTIAMLEGLSLHAMPEGVDLRRICVAIDPQASEGTGDTEHPEEPETGIVAAGVGMCECQGYDKREEHGFVLEDESGSYSPNKWAQVSLNLHRRLHGDRIIGEQNNGGAMVENTIRTVDRNAPYFAVHASRGKRTRAEPVAALYEQGKIHHVGPRPQFALLEDQLTTWNGSGPSPNRLDALVWAITDLMLVGEESTAELWNRADLSG